MFIEITRARQAELLANARKIATMAEFERLGRVERLQGSLRVARARLGLFTARASQAR